MRDAIAIAFSIGLPWIAGALCAFALQRRSTRPSTMLSIGYGYLVGVLATTGLMRALDALGVHWTLTLTAALLLVLAAIGFLVGRRAPLNSLHAWREYWRERHGDFVALPTLQRAMFWIFLALIAVRLCGLGLELLWRPLLPWDAWAHWATKARVWYEYGHLSAFVSPDQWLKGGDVSQFVDAHSDYPATVPLLQVWTALVLGHWDESLINAPWLALIVSLGLAFYAQLRRIGTGAGAAMLLTYLLLSLPIVDVHVALAGYADVFVATAYGLATISTWQWVRTRDRSDAMLAALMALACIACKKEGMLWVLTLILPVVMAFHRRLGLAMLALAAVAIVAYLVFGPTEVRVLGYLLRTQFRNVWGPLLTHFYVQDNWHLLWYAALVVVVLNYRTLLGNANAPMTATMLVASAFVFIVFFYSSAARGVEDATLVNRLPLHMVPALAFYLISVWQARRTASPAIAAQPPPLPEVPVGT